MIQRIQTFYLFLVLILSSVTLFSPVAVLFNKESATLYEISYKGLCLLDESSKVPVSSVWALTAISAIVPVVTLIIIFLYNKRLIQIRLSIFNMIIMLGYYVILFIYLFYAAKTLHADWSLKIVSAFPLVNIILTLLAMRAIAKDEALIKSLNRLR
ncbi:MAG TPA: DUF4293 domain-containing protein [Paludibacteraceae bacterium]|nr:DUF4293 domain-containing protein [Paludibacteraceae bacterium]HOL28624.1 DUF4293 domain-containing protein [Paludibacteraceae bacterium]HON01712.1 DUF4293 domain-containing protein [Paludibacteraceae bacterium]HPD58664.1 DUF4293 domain-containing protein [Paludibacteraceae bacterium]HPQ12204.1 DUF4293 domain-containing protein [Paludibacteraceae bacterium]